MTYPASAYVPEVPENSAPWLHWNAVATRVNQMWDPKNTPHHSIVGLTGSGKSYLCVNGILRPMCSMDRVVLFDTKGDDEVFSSVGRPVRELPRNTWYGKLGRRRDEPMDHWWRIVIHEDKAKAQQQVFEALDRIHKEGNYVSVLDEIHFITATKHLKLEPQVDTLYRLGRNRGNSVIACTQAPRYVVSSFYDQASFAWIGHIRDEQRQKRLLEIGGMSRKELPLISTLKRREWLLSADSGEFFARTKVVGREE